MKIKHYLLIALAVAAFLGFAQGCANSNGYGPGAHVIFGATS
jgi:hypothetical protein